MQKELIIDDWHLPISYIPSFRNVLPYHFYSSKKYDLGILIYNILEVRMNTSAGIVAIFSRIKGIEVWHDASFSCFVSNSNSNIVQWFKYSPVFVIKVLFLDDAINKKLVVPLVFIDSSTKKFATVKSRGGLILEVEEQDNNHILIKENLWKNERTRELTVMNEKVIPLDSLNWKAFPLTNDVLKESLEKQTYLL